jgi:GT2 family glycosyltransferase
MSVAHPQVSAVVVSWNTHACIGAALDSMGSACASLSYETVVVDNGSTDGSIPWLRARRDVRLLELGSNTGFTHAANVGVAAARGDYVLFLNPDVVAPRGSIAALVDALDVHPDAWAVTPWFRNPDGTPQHFWRRAPTVVTVVLCHTRWGRRIDRIVGGAGRRRRIYAELPDPPPLTAIEAVGAACLLVRADEFRSVGGFDERFFNFFQDTDLERRMRRRDRRLLGIGAIEVAHQMGVTFREMEPWEYDGQFLHALRQYLAGEPWHRRAVSESAVRLDLLLPGVDRDKRRERALRPLGVSR